MNIWQILDWAAWAISALLFGWMFVDAFRVGQQHDEDFLLSSREGVDELFANQNKGTES